MAVSKQDVLDFIAANATSKRPNVPAKDIVAALGIEARAVIAGLKGDGTLRASRGRIGGLQFADAAPAVQSEDAASTTSEQDDVASQFAALMEKLDADAAAESADAAQAVAL